MMILCLVLSHFIIQAHESWCVQYGQSSFQNYYYTLEGGVITSQVNNKNQPLCGSRANTRRAHPPWRCRLNAVAASVRQCPRPCCYYIYKSIHDHNLHNHGLSSKRSQSWPFSKEDPQCGFFVLGTPIVRETLYSLRHTTNHIIPPPPPPPPPPPAVQYVCPGGQISTYSSSMSLRLTKRPLIRGRLSASFLRQSYLMRFLQIRRARFAWNLAIRAFRASGR